MRMIKAILIDPFACEVKLVEYDGNDHRNIYPLLSHEVHKVDTFTTAQVDTLKGNDALFVDDNGLLNGPVRWFQIGGGHQPFAGKGLIVGADEDGESASCETSVDLVRMATVFAERDPASRRRLRMTTEPWEVEEPTARAAAEDLMARNPRVKEAPARGQGTIIPGAKKP